MNNLNIKKSQLLLKTLTLLLVFSISLVQAREGSSLGSSMQNQAGGVFGYIAIQLQTYIASVTVLSRSIAGIVGFIGALKIYIMWTLGNRMITKSIIAWGGAMLFLHLIPLVVKHLFS